MKFIDADSAHTSNLGKWGIIRLKVENYWFLTDGQLASGLPFRLDSKLRYGDRGDLVYQGYIDTWSCDYHLFTSDTLSFSDMEGKLGSGNIWPFSDSEEAEYGDIIWKNPYMH
ncbi:hypothetical protein ASPBRDRAFT_603997 [Aspergillus brasiliensis CBS 101740]|uniref:Uncharacterized protein n=1 Tax=Aspergillus brasiliensis (strain CBS 101740 / IMI 381727 / IBT 21946) TaxID=767769 RepID=A0A1L9UHG8_ASPBC|nr:hypothetical protein ASPBRDRAFT_603997 [Aspergillus brasiliensis CBS 101740]